MIKAGGTVTHFPPF